jgi:hypothetical protein
LLGNFAKVMSACLPVRPHGTTRLPLDGFSWNLILKIFRKSVEKIQVSLKSDKNSGYFTWRTTYFYDRNWPILLTMRNVSHKFVDNIKTHIFGSITFSRKSCRLWDNVEKYGRARQDTDDNIKQRMRFACFIIKATDTLTICNNYSFSTATVVTRTRPGGGGVVTFIRTLPLLLH